MKSALEIYITKWVEIRKVMSERHRVIFTIEDNSGKYGNEDTLFFGPFKEFPFDMNFEELEKNEQNARDSFLKRLEPLKSNLDKNAYRCLIKLSFNEKTQTEAGVCFGGVGEKEKFFERTDQVRMKIPLSLEETTFFTTVLFKLENKKDL